MCLSYLIIISVNSNSTSLTLSYDFPFILERDMQEMWNQITRISIFSKYQCQSQLKKVASQPIICLVMYTLKIVPWNWAMSTLFRSMLPEPANLRLSFNVSTFCNQSVPGKLGAGPKKKCRPLLLSVKSRDNIGSYHL